MRGGASGGPLAVALERVRRGLVPVGAGLAAEGMASPDWSGKLIRPLVGYAGAGRGGEEGCEGLWQALAAVQLAHEASLLHDDVIDGASERRGDPTVAASRGVAAALVEGDHLLTSAYRVALRAGSVAWAELFAQAVERTVAGEKAQARAAGRALSWSAYEAIVLGKSGELLGAALAAGPMLRGDWGAHRYYELGRRVGLIYQMLDDLLDYCPHVDTGKPALGDYARDLWTWPRAYADLPAGLDPEEVGRRLREPDATGVMPLDRCLGRLRVEAMAVSGEAAKLLPGDVIIQALLESWLERADAAVASARPRVELPPVAGWEQLMEEHAKSFRFASRLFPPARREQVVGVYAWCRYTDDLVDGVERPRRELEARLDAWLQLSRRAYDGEVTGNALADRVMPEMREAGVPFGYAAELVEGMRMDVRGHEYPTLDALFRYTYRVASVVGLWMTELFGIRDPWMLDRAASLGHAMQLTNILRDVGEDLDAGRLYLPTSWLEAHGLTREELERMRRTGAVDERYRALVEGLMAVAEEEYDRAAPAIARLPDFFRRPVAVAADVYRGIHGAIRANEYDNLTRRAYTTLGTKLRLGAGALWRARREPEHAPGRRVAVLGAAALLAGACGLWTPASASSQEWRPTPTVAPVEASVPADRALEAIGSLWVLAVEAEAAVEAGLDAIAMRRAHPEPLDEAGRRLLRAYHGAFLALKAKHGGWPPDRLRNLREGLARLDAVVEDAPDDAAVRYVRLMSGFYLPGFFGRQDEADADLAALARLLPDSADAFPPALYGEVVAFVLEHGDPTPEQRRRLEAVGR